MTGPFVVDLVKLVHLMNTKLDSCIYLQGKIDLRYPFIVFSVVGIVGVVCTSIGELKVLTTVQGIIILLFSSRD